MYYGLAQQAPEVPTIRVLMQKTAKATLDGGSTVREFEAGREYDLPDWLAEAFFREGEADPAEAHMQSADASQEPLAASVEADGASGGVKTRRGARRAKNGAAAGV